MCVRSDPMRCKRWLEQTLAAFGVHVTEKVLLVLPGFFDEEDKIAVDDINPMMLFLGLRPTKQEITTLTEELDPNGVGYFLLDESRPIFQFLADNLASVVEVADEQSKSEALRDGYEAAKEILGSIKGAGRREKFFEMLESLVSDIGKLSESELEKIFKKT